jgi:hypothetical protein
MKGKTRRREWKEICLGQKTSRERRAGKDEEERRERNMPGAKDLRRRSGVRRGTRKRRRKQEMGRSVILVQMAEKGFEQQQSQSSA